MKDVTSGHTVLAYNEDLKHLRGMVMEMGELVLEQTQNAVKALAEGDGELARRVIERERRVNQFDIETDEEVLDVIVRRQPAAIDLRLVLALSKVVANLERAGDKAEEIAWCTIRVLDRNGKRPKKKVMRHVLQLNEMACCLLERSLDALAKLDVEAAIGVIKDDADLDEEFDAALRHLITFVFEDPGHLGHMLDLVFTLKALERIGDHATNIAEQVIFIAEGRDVRYQNAENLAQGLIRD